MVSSKFHSSTSSSGPVPLVILAFDVSKTRKTPASSRSSAPRPNPSIVATEGPAPSSELARESPGVKTPYSRIFGVIAITLSAAFFFVTLSESLVKSPTSDEPPHLASGLFYVSTGIFRGNLQHPPLLKELSGLSLLLGGIRWPRNPETEFLLHGDIPKGTQPEWEIGNKIIVSNGPDHTLFWARLPFIFISSLLGILIYFWGRELVGGLAALFATFLYVTDPTILGQAFTVTMDAGLTAFSVLFFYALWRYLRNPTVRRLLLCGLALGLVLCAKVSALLWLPVAGLLVLAAVVWPAEPASGRTRQILDPFYIEPGETSPIFASFQGAGRNDPCPCGSGKKYKACHGSQAIDSPAAWLSRRWMLCAAAMFAMCLIAAVVIEAVYFFPKDPFLYVHGAKLVNADHRTDYQPYMAGELRNRFPDYFVVAYLLKEPLAGIILAAAGLILLFRRKSITPIARLFLLVPPVLFFIGTAILADQIGIRYIMPILPFAHLLGGLALAALFTATAKWGRWVAVAMCGWLALAAGGVYPDHLSYFNESACLLGDPSKLGLDGGSKCGILWLDDSNVDWGGGLKQLKVWLDSHEKDRAIRYATQFAFPPDTYGIAYEKASPLELAKEPLSGLYVVSAGLVARMPAIPGAKDWLRRTPTVAVVGHALYVYDIP